MKYLVLVGVLLLVYFLWRSQRRSEQVEKRQDASVPAALPMDMVRCPVCSLHLPRADALAGSDGLLYCSAEHRQGANT